MPGTRGTPLTVSQSALLSELRGRLAAAGDAVKAPQMQAYMKSDLPFRGVTAVPLHRICREVFSSHRLADEASWRDAVLALWNDAEFREERYAAVELTGHRYYREYQRVQTLGLYRHLAVTGAWWDFVDTVAGNRVGPILRASFDEVAPLIRAWAEDDDMWVRRTAILCQLGSKSATDPDLLGAAIGANLEESRFGTEFFIRKAIGWALREYAKTDPEWVLGFVADHQYAMSGLSRREALKSLH